MQQEAWLGNSVGGKKSWDRRGRSQPKFGIWTGDWGNGHATHCFCEKVRWILGLWTWTYWSPALCQVLHLYSSTLNNHPSLGMCVAWGRSPDKRCCSPAGSHSAQHICFRHILIRHLAGRERAADLKSSTQVESIWSEKSNFYSKCAKGWAWVHFYWYLWWSLAL